MLSYESRPVEAPEPGWRLVVAVVLGGLACAVGLLMWWQTAPGLWTLATVTPRGRIRPMGFMMALFLLMIGGMLSMVLLAAPAAGVSRRRAAKVVAGFGAAASILPALNFVLFFVIVMVRRIELGD